MTNSLSPMGDWSEQWWWCCHSSSLMTMLWPHHDHANNDMQTKWPPWPHHDTTTQHHWHTRTTTTTSPIYSPINTSTKSVRTGMNWKPLRMGLFVTVCISLTETTYAYWPLYMQTIDAKCKRTCWSACTCIKHCLRMNPHCTNVVSSSWPCSGLSFAPFLKSKVSAAPDQILIYTFYMCLSMANIQ